MLRDFNFNLSRLRWIPLCTGIIAVGLGIWCLVSPVTSIPFMAYAFAAILCVAGVVNLVFAAVNRSFIPNWGWSLAIGLIDLVAGIWLLCLPEPEVAVTFVIVLGIWMLCVAINAICETLLLSESSGWWTFLSIVLLVIAIYFAVVFLSSPGAMAVAGWLYLGFSLLCYGVFRICLYWRIRQLAAR